MLAGGAVAQACPKLWLFGSECPLGLYSSVLSLKSITCNVSLEDHCWKIYLHSPQIPEVLFYIFVNISQLESFETELLCCWRSRIITVTQLRHNPALKTWPRWDPFALLFNAVPAFSILTQSIPRIWQVWELPPHCRKEKLQFKEPQINQVSVLRQ